MLPEQQSSNTSASRSARWSTARAGPLVGQQARSTAPSRPTSISKWLELAPRCIVCCPTAQKLSMPALRFGSPVPCMLSSAGSLGAALTPTLQDLQLYVPTVHQPRAYCIVGHAFAPMRCSAAGAPRSCATDVRSCARATDPQGYGRRLLAVLREGACDGHFPRVFDFSASLLSPPKTRSRLSWLCGLGASFAPPLKHVDESALCHHG